MAVDAWREAILRAMATAYMGANYTQAQIDDDPEWYAEAVGLGGFAYEDAEVMLAAALGTTYQPECETCGGNPTGPAFEPDYCPSCNGQPLASRSALVAGAEAVGWLVQVGWSYERDGKKPDLAPMTWSPDRHDTNWRPAFHERPALPSVPESEK